MAHKTYFYKNPSDIPHKIIPNNTLIALDGEEHRHLFKVTRHKAGDIIFILPGDGRVFECELTEVTKQRALARIITMNTDENEPVFKLTLAQAIPKLPRFEWLLEKIVELGITELWPIQTEFSEDFARKNKQERWHKIMLNAMKQCGRTRFPEFKNNATFEEILAARHHFDIAFIAHAPVPENGNIWQKQIVDGAKSGVLLIGPEGGFSEQEIAAAVDANFQFIPLGPRRLRSETAGITAAGLVMAQAEDW